MKSTKSRRTRRKYDENFKAEVVRRHLEGESGPELADHFGISSTALIYRWKEQALAELPVGGCISATQLEAEVRDLRRQLKRVEQERDVLKKALSIFSQQG